MDIETILAETIQDLGSVPSGHLYAHIMSIIPLDRYNEAIENLIGRKLIKVVNFEIFWIG